MMRKTIFAAALLLAVPAFAQNTDPTQGATTIPPTANSSSGAVVTGAVDAPKTTTSGNEKVTTDAAGVPKGTAGSASASNDVNATAATKRKHHHRRTLPATPER
jgi:hypothetical protein